MIGSASPGGEKRFSRSHSPSQSRQANKDHQEEQSSLDFVPVVTTLRCLNESPEALSESRKIHGFHAAVKDDSQPASSYKMLVGSVSADIDDRVSSTSLGMSSQKVSLSCCSIQVSAAGCPTGSRGRTLPRIRLSTAM